MISSLPIGSLPINKHWLVCTKEHSPFIFALMAALYTSQVLGLPLEELLVYLEVLCVDLCKGMPYLSYVTFRQHLMFTDSVPCTAQSMSFRFAKTCTEFDLPARVAPSFINESCIY